MGSPKQRYSHLFPICEGISAWLYPHAEVVIHDLKSDTIVGIWNNLSRRTAGEASLIEEDVQFQQEADVYGPYTKSNWDGRSLKCISSVIKDSDGERIGLLCLNLDTSRFDAMKAFIDSFTETASSLPTALSKRDWREQINESLSIFLREENTAITALKRAQKIAFIKCLDERNLFATRNAAQHVASVLSVSRATIYNWLSKARSES